MISIQQLKTICPTCKISEQLVPILNIGFEKFKFTQQQIAMFIAQTAHESSEFNIFEENLNYSSDGLLKIFPKYFTKETAINYHRKPEAIANIVYANRMGNGNSVTGDGWKFRGRGIIMTTGKENYSNCSKELYKNETILLITPELLKQPDGAINSAFWFWDRNKINTYSDIVKVTKIINGGKIGIAERQNYYDKAKQIIM